MLVSLFFPHGCYLFFFDLKLKIILFIFSSFLFCLFKTLRFYWAFLCFFCFFLSRIFTIRPYRLLFLPTPPLPSHIFLFLAEGNSFTHISLSFPLNHKWTQIFYFLFFVTNLEPCFSEQLRHSDIFRN